MCENKTQGQERVPYMRWKPDPDKQERVAGSEQIGEQPSRSLPSTLRECARKHQSEADSLLVIAAILESSTSLNQQEQMIPFFIKALNATRV